jgi:hypothetical protein
MTDPMESVIHKFADFLLSTDTRACGKPKAQIRDLEPQATHRPITWFPQGRVRFCGHSSGP